MNQGARETSVQRKTRETTITAHLNLDGKGRCEIATGVGFLNHMLELLGKHALFDLECRAEGDLEVDAHHTTEDVGIALGQALARALGEKKGITRFADARTPMEDSLCAVALDLSGRGHLSYNAEFPAPKVGEFDVELVEEFFRAFCANGGVNMHVDVVRGGNCHHIAEAIFKATARALKAAVALDPRLEGDVPSTKGIL
ncbi:MAG: imidazoleglycerol-phosphate dehydratase HisB [Planctomycetes bacterium]|nr:imidazoleglycerol-phosphate dehydratase HisB [Planctomycetota bacterium]